MTKRQETDLAQPLFYFVERGLPVTLLGMWRCVFQYSEEFYFLYLLCGDDNILCNKISHLNLEISYIILCIFLNFSSTSLVLNFIQSFKILFDLFILIFMDCQNICYRNFQFSFLTSIIWALLYYFRLSLIIAHMLLLRPDISSFWNKDLRAVVNCMQVSEC